MRGTYRVTAPLLAAGCLLALAGLAAAGVMPAGSATDYGASGRFDLGRTLVSEPAPVRGPAIGFAGESLISGTDASIVANFSRLSQLSATPATSALGRSQKAVVYDAPQMSAENTLNTQRMADAGEGRTGNPLQDFNYLSVTPQVFLVARSGRPAGEADKWQQTMQTSLSYVRPHRNLQFLMNIHSSGITSGAFAGGPIGDEVQMLEDMSVQEDSRNLGARGSDRFGIQKSLAKHDSSTPGRMAAVGVDLGLLPAALGDVGLSMSIVVGESANPGPFISVATNLEVPSDDSGGGERLANSVYQPSTTELGGDNSDSSTLTFASGLSGSSNPPTIPTPPTNPIVPISPTVPEPASLLLLGAGLALVLRRGRKVA
jgi:hypothetical protein